MRFTERNSPPPFRRRLFPPPFLLLPSDPPRPSPSFVPEEAVVLSFRKRTYGREGGREGEKRRGKLNRSREEGTTDGPDGAELGHTLEISENERRKGGGWGGTEGQSRLYFSAR